LHWNELLTARGIQNEQVLDYLDFLKHPQVEATGLISWLEQPGLPHPVPVPIPPGAPKLKPNGANAKAPTTGEHTEAVLTALAAGNPWRD
jgi:crotonobetainyl-CoA:carnitine CoA-transferase CaiB-like acyl-CoA transferase